MIVSLDVSEVCVLSFHPAVTRLAQIITDHHDHLVQLWSHLHAARESSETRVALIALLNASLLCEWLFVQFREPRVGNVNTALRAVNTRTVEVNWNLVWHHRVFFVASVAVWVHAWNIVSFHHFEETFSGPCCHASWNTIGRDGIDPNDLVSHLDAASFNVWSQHISSETL